MLNRDGIRKAVFTSDAQILANVELQASVGCVVDATLGVAVGDRKIVKAGTPVEVDFNNLNTVVKAGAEGTANAVLLHNVDVTDGNANGTALIFGFVNLNRLDADVKTLVAGVKSVAGITFLAV